MNRRAALDQWALTEPGSDRGLGRYARAVHDALSLSSRWDAVYVRNETRSSFPTPLAVQRELMKLKRDPVDLYHSTSVFNLPLLRDLPWVCSIHDIIPLDLTDYQNLGIKTRLQFRNAVRSDAILTLSTFSADRIIQRLGIPAKKITVAPLSVSKSYLFNKNPQLEQLSRDHMQAPYIVALADGRSFDPRKRNHWIDQVGAELSRLDVSMIVTGRGLKTQSFPNCTVLPPMDDHGLANLYRRAHGFFYPTAYEGQGLPPLEAMASGCPVVAFSNTSLPETVGAGGVLLDDPVPWTEGRLDSPLPLPVARRIAELFHSWVNDPSAFAAARSAALIQSAKIRREYLTEALEDAYERATGRGW